MLRTTLVHPSEGREEEVRAVLGQLEAMLAAMLGRQAAEELLCEDVTTGASSDLQSATTLARKMVTEYGMSDELGPQTFDNGQDHIFLGRDLAERHRYSDAVAQKIDAEVGALLRKARDTAKRAIELNRARLSRVVEGLLAEETLQGAALQEMLGNALADEALAA